MNANSDLAAGLFFFDAIRECARLSFHYYDRGYAVYERLTIKNRESVR